MKFTATDQQEAEVRSKLCATGFVVNVGKFKPISDEKHHIASTTGTDDGDKKIRDDTFEREKTTVTVM